MDLRSRISAKYPKVGEELFTQTQAAQAQITFGRDSCLWVVLCYKDLIYKGLYGKQRFCFKVIPLK